MKIFGLEIRLGNTQVDLKKVDELLLKTTKSVRQAKTDWIAYSEALNSLKGHELILQFMKEYEAKAKTTTVARRAMTAEEKVAARQSRESAKAAEMQVLAEKSRLGSIRQLEAEVAKLTILWKALSREERTKTNEGRAMTAQLASMRKELRETKMAAGDFSGNIGNYISTLYNGLTSKFALISGLVMGFKRLIGGVFGPFQDLEYRMSQVRAVSRATDAEFAALTQNARQLGATTEYTATEVAGLQLAYARMGFVPEQIQQITRATLNLATATGEDLAKSADVVGTTLRGFNLNADQTQRVVDVMAQSFNATSLQLDSFYESMKYVAPIAATANVSLEETTAMLGVLADRGIRGSQAGTALRRIFTEIAKEGGSVTERLDQLSKKGLTLGGAMDEVGRYAMTALTVLAGSKGSVDELTVSLDNAAGAAEKAADIMRDNMKGDLDKFLSATKEKLIAIGETLASLARSVMQFGTWAVTNLKTITTALLTYVGVVKSLTLAKAAYYAVVKLAYGNTISFGRAVLAEIGSVKSATAATRALTGAKLLFTVGVGKAKTAIIGFGRAVMANPWGLAITLLAGIAALVVTLTRKTDLAAASQKRYNDELDRFNKAQDEKRQRIDQLIRTIQDETETEAAKIRAYEELERLAPSLTTAYKREQLAVLELTKSSKLLNEQRDKENYDDQKAKLSRLVEVYNQLADAHGDWNRVKLTEEEHARYSGQTTQSAQKAVQTDIDTYQKGVKEIERLRAEADESNKPIKVRIFEAEADVERTKTEFDKAVTAYNTFRDKWIKERGTDRTIPFHFKFDKLEAEKQYAEAQKKLEELKKQPKVAPTGGDDEKGEWSLSKDKAHNDKLLALKAKLYSGEIAADETYNKQVLQLEIETLTKRIALNKDGSKVLVKLKNELADKEYQQKKTKKKEAENAAAKIKAQQDLLLKYENDHIDAGIAAMKDGVDKKIQLNDQSTKKAQESALKEYQTEVDKIDKEQEKHKEGSAEYAAAEAQKTSVKAAYAQKKTDIEAAGAGARVKILRDATEEELREYAKIPGVAEEAERQITENKRRETEKRLKLAKKETEQSVERAGNQYNANEAQADATLGKTGRKRNVARLQNEVQLHRDQAQAYQTELNAILSGGDKAIEEHKARYDELIKLIGQEQNAAMNLGKGKTAGGERKSIWTQFTEMSDEEINQIKQQAIDLAGQIGSAIIDAQKQASQRRMNNEKKALEAQYKIESKLLDDKRDKGLISEKTYQRELEKLEAEKAKKDEEIERAAFEREKKHNIAQAWIDVAVGIAKIWATYGSNLFTVPVAIAQSAVLTAQGVIQTAFISSQKYAQGGLIPLGDGVGVVKGRSHAQGGHRIYLDGRPIGEIEGDELLAIVNKHDTARIGALSAANSVHGRKFAEGGLVAPRKFWTSSVAPPAGFAALQGLTQAELSRQQEVQHRQREETTKLLLDNIEAINKRIDTLKVVVLDRDVTEAQENTKRVKVKSTW